MHAGGVSMMEATPRSRATWRSALHSLVKGGYVEEAAPQSGLFQLTKRGYSEADRLEASGSVPERIVIDLACSGRPQEQTIKVEASEDVRARRLEYCLSNGTIISSESLQQGGSLFFVQLAYSQLAELNNLPRADRNQYDNSGPILLRIAFAVRGNLRTLNLQAFMQPKFVDSTMWLGLTGQAHDEFSSKELDL